LLIILVLLLLGALPVWPHSRSWGYGGSGIVGFLLLLVISFPLAYKAALVFTIDFLHLFNPFHNFLFLVLNFLILLLPFFFGGVVLALIFSTYSDSIGRLYFIDLVGASIGSLAVIPLIPWLGPNRILILLFCLLALAWFFVATGRRVIRFAVFGVLIASFAAAFLFEARVFPIVPKLVEYKRHYNAQFDNKRIEYSKWSTIDKIDVAPWLGIRKVIWINGGTMQSFIWSFDGNLAKLKKIEWNTASLPYQLARNGTAVRTLGAGTSTVTLTDALLASGPYAYTATLADAVGNTSTLDLNGAAAGTSFTIVVT